MRKRNLLERNRKRILLTRQENCFAITETYHLTFWRFISFKLQNWNPNFPIMKTLLWDHNIRSTVSLMFDKNVATTTHYPQRMTISFAQSMPNEFYHAIYLNLDARTHKSTHTCSLCTIISSCEIWKLKLAGRSCTYPGMLGSWNATSN